MFGKIEDIPRLQELFAQILIVHHQARSDILKVKGSKFTDKELEGVIGDANKPVFVYEDEAGTILCHLFLIIKEVSEMMVLKNLLRLSLLMIFVLKKKLVDKN